MRSIRKKLKTISKSPIKSIEAIGLGLKNYKNPTKEMEEKAMINISHCLKCPFYSDEKNDLLKFSDDRIPEADEKMCGECGCALALKIRQNLIPCERWKDL